MTSVVHLAMRDHPAATTVVTRAVLDARDQEGVDAEMIVGGSGCDAAARGPFEKAELEQERFVDIHHGVSFLGDRSGQRVQADGTAADDAYIFFAATPPPPGASVATPPVVSAPGTGTHGVTPDKCAFGSL